MKKICIQFTLILCFVMLSACEGGGEIDTELFLEDRAREQSITIEIVQETAGPGAGRSNQEFYDRIMKFTEVRPHVEITIRSSDNQSFSLSPWLLGRRGVGDPPDIVELTPTQMKIWHMHGKLEPIGMHEPQLQDIVITSADGYVLGIKNKINPLLVYYNKDIFMQLGLDPPSGEWDWAELDDTIASLKAAGQNVYIPISAYVLEWLTVNRYGGAIVDPSGTVFSGYMDSEAAVQAAEWLTWVGTKDEDYKLRGTAGHAYYDPFPLDLVDGNMALGIHYAYRINIDTTGHYEAILERSDQIGIASLPGGAEASSIAKMTGYAIRSDSPNKEASMELLRYLVDSEDVFRDTMRRMSRTGESVGVE